MTSRFLTDLVVVHVSDDIKRLVYPLEYESALLGRLIVVPEGTETDFSSVPRLPFAFWLFGGIGDKAAVVHDALYSGKYGVSRKQADDVFSEALKVCGVGAIRRGLMYSAVRLAGASHYTASQESMAP